MLGCQTLLYPDIGKCLAAIPFAERVGWFFIQFTWSEKRQNDWVLFGQKRKTWPRHFSVTFVNLLWPSSLPSSRFTIPRHPWPSWSSFVISCSQFLSCHISALGRSRVANFLAKRRFLKSVPDSFECSRVFKNSPKVLHTTLQWVCRSSRAHS